MQYRWIDSCYLSVVMLGIKMENYYEMDGLHIAIGKIEGDVPINHIVCLQLIR